MKQFFRNPRLLGKIILICIILSFISISINSEEQIPKKPETVTEKMYGQRLPAVKKAMNLSNIEISEMLFGSESAYNTIWSREDKLDLKTRELCTISILTALDRPEELLGHIACAVNLGWKLEEIKETYFLCIISAGWPKALNALRTWAQYCESNKIPLEEDLNIRHDFYTRDWHKTGNDVGTKLFGKKEWEIFKSEISYADPYVKDFVVSNYYGKLYTRTILDERVKSLCVVSSYAALRSKKLLRLSIIGALNSGVSREEISQALLNVRGYAGLEAVLDAIEVYKSVKS